MLTGPDLLAKVKSMAEASKSDLVRACGYVTTKADGSERLNFTAFYEALLVAKGVEVGAPSKAGRSVAGRKLSFSTKVQFNGNLLVGKAYTAQLGLEPGDQFEIKLGRKQIVLSRLDGTTNPDPSDLEACAFGAADVVIPEAEELRPQPSCDFATAAVS